ncbi:sodium:proton antiporter [Aurantimonas sp. VKM B-3413]|uniref:cation:proton antiporter n=1 Tax=Aurantimonas sp. VKM B-3413 TaxID=2779401 RepID=UPI001E45C420|nr:cation:proton antiporter [Aurantimonas sp. VKM B-3413]MCB8838620.1 cation:proton antiporter [Aurantimonas sp. VKM B-3413]
MTPAVTMMVGGILVILAVWVPLFLRGIPLSLPMIAVVAGAALPSVGGSEHPLIRYSGLVEAVTQFALIVAVIGAGLKIDRRFSLRGWTSTWRLLLLVMPLTIAAIALSAMWLLGLSLGLAIFLASALAPTDPVLAANVQTGEPGTGDEDETRFALTSEAGLNDGLAYPFVVLGISLASGPLGESGWERWAIGSLAWNVVGGAAVGAAVASALVILNDQVREPFKLRSSGSGIAAVGLAFLAYGCAELVEANGFIAVFAEAVAIRNFVPSYAYSRRLNHASEEFEKVLMVMILAVLGASVWQGLLAGIGWREIAFAAIALVVARPLATFFGFLGSGETASTRKAVGFFGIRGIASLYYASLAVPHLPQGTASHLMSIIGLTVLASIFFFGVTADTAAKFCSGKAQKRN